MRLMLKQHPPYNIMIKMKFLLNNDPNLSPNVTEPKLEHFLYQKQFFTGK